MPEAFITHEGVRLWTVTKGAGQAVMLLNGGPGCPDYLGPVAEMIDDVAQIVRFEERGCGRSDASPPYSVETSVRDLEAVRRHYGVTRWVIGGHSWGPNLALAYALKYPAHVSGLLCLSGGRIHNDRTWHEQYRRLRDDEFRLEFSTPPNMEVNKQVNASWNAYVQRPHLLRDIARLDVPALFLYGDEDIRPSWPTEQLAALLPKGHFEIVKGAHHYPWLTHPEEVKELLRGFLGGLE